MPCTFEAYVQHDRPTWRSRDNLLTPASNQDFTVGLHVNGGACGRCRIVQHDAVAWTSVAYVLCLSCATNEFGAPDLRTYRPELFEYEMRDEDYVETPEKLETKRDKDFDPRKYKVYKHSQDLTGKYGCAGYRCETYPAPDRTIPANTTFMLGESMRGHLCLGCFEKLKAKYDAMPNKAYCPYCSRRVSASSMQPVLGYDAPSVCSTCLRDDFINCPDTDGGFIQREGSVYALTPVSEGNPQRRVYASHNYASRHWTFIRDRWFISEEEADRELFSLDANYRDQKIAQHEGHAIFAYGTNVIKMYGFPEVTKRDELCFGVELEMQPNSNHTQSHVVAALGSKYVNSPSHPYILCRDSSIGDRGVELITLPYTLANHKSDKFMPWTKLLGELRKVAQSGQNNTQCGMHVHINRRALSNLQMGKMLVAINAPEMQELIATIAQRNEAAYCGRYFKKVADGGKIIGSHGDALNMSNSKGTVELRIFRGNLRYERVMKNLEFAEALCLYAQDQSIQLVHLPAQMVEWINDNNAHYPYLAKFIAEEYQPTKAYARTAARLRNETHRWGEAVSYVNIEPTEGDI